MSEQRDTKQVIVIRRDLHMRRGKEVAQGAHAAMAWLAGRLHQVGGIYTDDVHTASVGEAERHWLASGTRKVTCQVSSEEEVLALADLAGAAGVQAHVITDAGLTEFGGVPTVTAVAIGPDWDENVDKVTAGLRLY